jgi:hypothetical protein
MPPEEINEITAKIIGCAYEVGNMLGIGFVEKIYFGKPKIETKRLLPSVHWRTPKP